VFRDPGRASLPASRFLIRLGPPEADLWRIALPESRKVVQIGDEVIFHGDHATLVRGLVADCAASPLTHCNVYRVVDLAPEMFEPDTGEWVPHEKLFKIGSPHDER
jgi:hypothetical protein